MERSITHFFAFVKLYFRIWPFFLGVIFISVQFGSCAYT